MTAQTLSGPSEGEVVLVAPGLRWRLLWPARMYFLHFPWPRGKGLIRRKLLYPALPAAPGGFLASGEKDTKIALWYREIVGFATLTRGTFEPVEVRTALASVSAGDTVIDVGANVGLFTIPLAKAVGESGQLLAIEPLPQNAHRLSANARRNSLSNVRILQLAIGATSGVAQFHIGNDPAYSSISEIAEDRMDSGSVMEVPVSTLDEIWTEKGRPQVSFIKIDVEGGEFGVLEGSRNLLSTCRPSILLESYDDSKLRNWFTAMNYRDSTPPDFKSGNHLYVYQ